MREKRKVTYHLVTICNVHLGSTNPTGLEKVGDLFLAACEPSM